VLLRAREMAASETACAFWTDNIRRKIDNWTVRILANHDERINGKSSFVVGLDAVGSGALRQTAADPINLPVHHCYIMPAFFVLCAGSAVFRVTKFFLFYEIIINFFYIFFGFFFNIL
jgi:hypothetical protein